MPWKHLILYGNIGVFFYKKKGILYSKHCAKTFYKDIHKVIQLFSQMAKIQRGILIRMINFIKSDKVSLGTTKYQLYHLELLVFRKL